MTLETQSSTLSLQGLATSDAATLETKLPPSCLWRTVTGTLGNN